MQQVGLGLPVAIAAVAFFGVYFRWIESQALHSWRSLEDWGHAFIIPLISGFIVWRRRERLAAAGFEPFWPGIAPLLLGLVGYFFAVVVIRNHMAQGVMMLLALFGLVLLLFGAGAMRSLFLPLALLGFAVTLPQQWMAEVTFRLQLIASEGSYLMLSALAPVWKVLGSPYSVDVQGNTLTMISGSSVIPLNVAEACSGMRMVIAFYALAAAVAVLSCRSWWQRVLLVLLAGPVAVAMNVVRVAVLGLASLYDPELAAGDAHMMIGTVLLIPSVLLFMGIVWLLKRVETEPAPRGPSAAGVAS